MTWMIALDAFDIAGWTAIFVSGMIVAYYYGRDKSAGKTNIAG